MPESMIPQGCAKSPTISSAFPRPRFDGGPPPARARRLVRGARRSTSAPCVAQQQPLPGLQTGPASVVAT